MATNEESENPTTGTEAKDAAQEKSNQRRATRRTTKKSTAKKATAKKSPAKKSAAKKSAAQKNSAQKSNAKKAPAQTAPASQTDAQDTAGTPNRLDRSTLGDRQRVYGLAKKLGITSKELIVALDAVGLVKVAQSSLSREEMDKVLDHIEQKSGDAAAPEATPVQDKKDDVSAEEKADTGSDESEERIRTRVRKNVANEIHQIEEKVEADLAAVAETQPVEEAPEAVDEAPEPEAPEPETAEATPEEETESEEVLLEDVTPEITPAPQGTSQAAAYAPIFFAPGSEDSDDGEGDEDSDDDEQRASSSRRRRSTRRTTRRSAPVEEPQQQERPAEVVDEPVAEEPEQDQESQEDLPVEPVALHGSTRLEAQKRRRTEMREAGRKKKQIVSQAEFLARRESVKRTMVVRERHHIEDPDNPALITQVGVLEDDLLVEHFVTSEAQASLIGNIYLGRVQNVLPSMEAAFIDIGKGRNGVLYASEVDWKSAGLKGRNRRIEQALKSGDQVLVQVSKDPLGHKGARLTTQISLAGRYLVYVPGGRSAGISRKLPAPERKRLKDILGRVIPGEGGAIIRTAAENVPEEAIARDVNRLHDLWEDVQQRAEEEKASKGAKPVTLYEEPDMLVKVVRDLFNEDFTSLVVDGRRAWNTIRAYVDSVAPDLSDRLVRYDRRDHDDKDAFAQYRVDEQLQKALARKVWLPSGGSLVIDRTEAMTVVDVNTGKFTGSGGNLEETVTRNNLEAAEEIVRQMRLRDLGGMIVVDFIDMVLPENQDLVLRRLKEALGRDRTRHQVSEVTSLGLVQMTRKRLGTGLLETFSTECEVCGGRGLILHEDPVEHHEQDEHESRKHKHHKNKGRGQHPASRRPDKPEPSRTSSDEEFEELAASVVREAEPDTESQEPKESREETAAEPAQENRRSRRRGGRGRSRGRGREQQVRGERTESTDSSDAVDTVGSVEEVAAIAAAATERANEAEPEETAATPSAVTDGRSYEKAVKEFEDSPRRRRATRGNSRSDHRPKQEDFVKAPEQPDEVEKAQQDEPKPPRVRAGKSEQPKKKAETQKSAATTETTTTTASRRGRRRVVRRTTSAGQEQAQQKQEPKKEASASKPARKPQPEQQASTSGRRRRRATRRSGSK